MDAGDDVVAFMEGRRTAVLATLAPDGRPRLVPICFALRRLRGVAAGRDMDRVLLYSPLDEKPKRGSDPRALARVRDVLARPDVTLLFDRWDEDWSRLAWVRARGRARVIEPDGDEAAEHRDAVRLLRARYPQYARQGIDRRPMLRVTLGELRRWSADPEGAG